MVAVTFVGTGEATDPDLPNSSLLYVGASTVLLDCGYSVPHAFWRVTRDPNLLDLIFISHGHGDHTLGLPGLLLWMREQGRERPLRILAGPETCRVIRQVLDVAYPGMFDGDGFYPIEVVCVGDTEHLDGLRCSFAPTDHSASNLAVRIEEEGCSFCYSGDGRMSSASRSLFQGARLLVHECYNDEPGSRAHASAREILDEVGALGVEQLALVHLAAGRRSHIAEMVGGIEMPHVFIPQPGETVTLCQRD